MPKKRLTIEDLNARLERLNDELALLDHCVQLGHGSGDYRKVRAADEARQMSLRDVSRAIRQRQKLTAKAEVGRWLSPSPQPLVSGTLPPKTASRPSTRSTLNATGRLAPTHP